MPKTTTLTIVAFVALLAIASAQDKITVQFLAIPKQVRPEPVELLIGEGQTIEVQTPGNELSQEYQVPALESIVVGKTIINDDGESSFQVYGRAKSLNTSRQIVLLMRKGKDNEDGFVVLPINGDLGNFKGGTYFFVNASPLNIAVKIGDKALELEPGRRELIQPAATHDGGGCQVTFAYKREQDWKIFRDTRWTVHERYRSLVFFHQDAESGKLMVSPVVEILPYIP